MGTLRPDRSVGDDRHFDKGLRPPMDSTTLLGLVAGSLTTAAFLPQLVKVLKSRSTKDISLLMYIVICTGILLWLIYGVIIGSLPVITANAVTLLIASAILALKIRFR
jgi:MtN3 and saliva related transmembrane protein